MFSILLKKLKLFPAYGNMPMLFTTHFTIRKPLLSFLSSTDLLSFASINRQIYHDTIQDIVLRKKKVALEVFHTLYNPSHHGIMMKSYYYEYAIRYTRCAFYLIPELFALIQEKQCTTLKLSMVCDYSGCPKHIYDYYRGNISTLYQQILEGLRANTSLIKCNLGLFCSIINKQELKEIIDAHPTLQFISLHSGERMDSTPFILPS